MKKTSYPELLHKLYSLIGTKDNSLALRKMERALHALGNPEKVFKSIHITGTNGKGSVTLKIAEALIREGKKVGHYTSPHIGTFRERIQINGKKISEEKVLNLLPHMLEIGKGCSFFELTTLLAFSFFAEEKIDYGVIEVGIGGRLDATNVIHPLISVITSVSLDHTEWLGSTLEDIAKEKGGIIKPNVPLVVGPQIPSNVEKMAEEMHAPFYRVRGPFKTFDEENSAIAKKALQLLGTNPSAIEEGLQKMPPCRMEILEKEGITLIFDVAHNPGGFFSLFASLESLKTYKRYRVILGMGKEKDHRECLRILIPYAEEIFLTKAEGIKEGISVNILHTILKELRFKEERIYPSPSIKSAVENALARSKDDNLPLLILGSFFIMAEAMEAAKIPLERDPVFFQEMGKFDKKGPELESHKVLK